MRRRQQQRGDPGNRECIHSRRLVLPPSRPEQQSAQAGDVGGQQRDHTFLGRGANHLEHGDRRQGRRRPPAPRASTRAEPRVGPENPGRVDQREVRRVIEAHGEVTDERRDERQEGSGRPASCRREHGGPAPSREHGARDEKAEIHRQPDVRDQQRCHVKRIEDKRLPLPPERLADAVVSIPERQLAGLERSSLHGRSRAESPTSSRRHRRRERIRGPGRRIRRLYGASS